MDGREYSGQSQGNYQGLDLVADMYIGGVPDYSRIARSAGFREGFVGEYLCFSYFSLFLGGLLVHIYKKKSSFAQNNIEIHKICGCR